jgi:hypothetical protein
MLPDEAVCNPKVRNLCHPEAIRQLTEKAKFFVVDRSCRRAPARKFLPTPAIFAGSFTND